MAINIKAPSINDTLKIYDRASDYLHENPKADVFFVAILLLISVEVSLPGTFYWKLKFLVIPISILCAYAFGSQYRAHIAIGTTPLLVSTDLSIAGVVFVDFGDIGLYFANLLVHRFFSDHRFSKRVLNSIRPSPNFFLFVFLGMFLFPYIELEIGLGEPVDGDNNFYLNNLSIDPRNFLVLVFFLLGASKVCSKKVLAVLLCVFIMSFSLSTFGQAGTLAYDHVTLEIFQLTYSDPSFFISLICATSLGNILEKYLQNPETIQSSKRYFLAATLFACIFVSNFSLLIGAEISPDTEEITRPIEPPAIELGETQIGEDTEPDITPPNVDETEETTSEDPLGPVVLEEAVPIVFLDADFFLVSPILVALLLLVCGVLSTRRELVFIFFVWFAIKTAGELVSSSIESNRFNIDNPWGVLILKFSPHDYLFQFGYVGFLSNSGAIGLDYIIAVFAFVLWDIKTRKAGKISTSRLFSLGRPAPSRVALIAFGSISAAYTLNTLLIYTISLGLILLGFGGILQ